MVNDRVVRVAWAAVAILAMAVAFALGAVTKSTDTSPCVWAVESAREAFAAQAEFTRATGDFVQSLPGTLQAAWDHDRAGLERAQADVATFRDAATRMSEAVAGNEFDQYAAECVTEP